MVGASVLTFLDRTRHAAAPSGSREEDTIGPDRKLWVLAGLLAACNAGSPQHPLDASDSVSAGPPAAATASAAPGPGGFIFSPYKDSEINLDWNTNVLSTEVTGAQVSVLKAMPATLKTLTWAFATGECGREDWAGVDGAAFARANVTSFVSAGKHYIVSTGGALAAFTCTSDARFATFMKRYDSANLVGVDFDIEQGQSQRDIDNLVARVVVAQRRYPKIRFSFTVGTEGGSAGQSLSAYGVMTLKAIRTQGLKDYTINLMVMDYGPATKSNCVLGRQGRCDMGRSAIQAAVDLHVYHGVPYSQIELTPMIGGNDITDEVFTTQDVATVSAFVKQQGLAGVHFWSFDRDTDCPPATASDTCNTYGRAGILGFTNRFLSDLGLHTKGTHAGSPGLPDAGTVPRNAGRAAR